jgi:trigger factor
VRTTLEPLEGNKVKLSVEVDEAEFERAIDDAFRRIAREVRIPGFRPGKAPRRILEARLGGDVARQEALREALPDYFAQAVREHDVDIIAAPDIDITAGQEAGPVAFDAVVEVRPHVAVPGYQHLRVTVPSPVVGDDEVDAQVERMRAQFGELRVVERPAQDGDHVTIDVKGEVDGEDVEGLTAEDYLYEVGSGAVVPEIDEQLRGAKVGDILQFEADHPDPDEESRLSFRILVKEVKERLLPDVDDEWADEASEFETVEALRADIRERLAGMKRMQTQMSLRERAVEELVALVEDEPPAALVDSEVQRRAEDLVHRLSHQGLSFSEYLEATGRSQEEVTGELRESAERAVRGDLALRAVADAEDIAVTEEDLERQYELVASQIGRDAASVRAEFERADQVQAVRSDIRKGKALEWLVEHVELVDEEGQPIDRGALGSLDDTAGGGVDEHDHHHHEDHLHEESGE